MFGAKVFKYLLKIPAVIFIIAFVVLNRQETTFYYSPLAEPLILPMWIMGLVLFGIGFAFGALLLWINSWPAYRELRKARKSLRAYEKNDEKNDDSDDAIETRQDIVTYDKDI